MLPPQPLGFPFRPFNFFVALPNALARDEIRKSRQPPSIGAGNSAFMRGSCHWPRFSDTAVSLRSDLYRRRSFSLIGIPGFGNEQGAGARRRGLAELFSVRSKNTGRIRAYLNRALVIGKEVAKVGRQHVEVEQRHWVCYSRIWFVKHGGVSVGQGRCRSLTSPVEPHRVVRHGGGCMVRAVCRKRCIYSVARATRDCVLHCRNHTVDRCPSIHDWLVVQHVLEAPQADSDVFQIIRMFRRMPKTVVK